MRMDHKNRVRSGTGSGPFWDGSHGKRMLHSDPSVGIVFPLEGEYRGLSLPTVLLSVSCGQQWSENIKWKITEINNTWALNCTLLWVVGLNFPPSYSILPETWIILLSSVSTLYTGPACQLGAVSVIRLVVSVSQYLCASNPYFT